LTATQAEADRPPSTAPKGLGRWHVLTGEYPPQAGGVADYTAIVAGLLAGRGAEVHVWTTPAAGASEAAGVEAPAGVEVHRAAGRWSAAGLRGLGAELDAFPGPRRLLIQYTPHSWGARGMNLGFCRWVARRARAGDEVRAMFHEVAYPFRRDDHPKLWVVAAAQRLMARVLVPACARLYVSTPTWDDLLPRRRHPSAGPLRWLPVPSNVAEVADPPAVAAIRRATAPEGTQVLGSFGTFHGWVADLLRATLPPLLRGRPDRVALLIGRNGPKFAENLIAAEPDLDGRLVATGGLAARDASRHLQACDLMIQPYPDGVSTRRGSMMAVLAHGLPAVTTVGRLSEPIWAELGCVATAPDDAPAAFVAAAETLLADPDARARLGARARDVYERRFAAERTVEGLLRD
jgi:glycosyltransferase involved in cell wall biosynthesis